MQPQESSLGTFSTSHASKYIAQMCKHFGHKVETSHDDTSGKVAFAFGECSLAATDDRLEITVTAPDAEGIKTAQGIIDSHLKRFAFREGFEAMAWR